MIPHEFVKVEWSNRGDDTVEVLEARRGLQEDTMEYALVSLGGEKGAPSVTAVLEVGATYNGAGFWKAEVTRAGSLGGARDPDGGPENLSVGISYLGETIGVEIARACADAFAQGCEAALRAVTGLTVG
jgi:hypothetical protein